MIVQSYFAGLNPSLCLAGGLGGPPGTISPSLLASAGATGAPGSLDAVTGGTAGDPSGAFASLGVGMSPASAVGVGTGAQAPQSALLAAAAQSLRLANALTTGANNGSLSSVVLVSNLNEEVRAIARFCTHTQTVCKESSTTRSSLRRSSTPVVVLYT